MIMKQWAIGVDLGGTKIEVALVSPESSVHSRLRILTDIKQGYTAILNKITDILKQLAD